jgi:hypothetical protein
LDVSIAAEAFICNTTFTLANVELIGNRNVGVSVAMMVSMYANEAVPINASGIIMTGLNVWNNSGNGALQFYLPPRPTTLKSYLRMCTLSGVLSGDGGGARIWMSGLLPTAFVVTVDNSSFIGNVGGCVLRRSFCYVLAWQRVRVI